jgi:hypothetical protein
MNRLRSIIRCPIRKQIIWSCHRCNLRISEILEEPYVLSPARIIENVYDGIDPECKRLPKCRLLDCKGVWTIGDVTNVGEL